ncbi:MAG: hypothetical protein ACLFUT_11635 [Desulfobacteraceae bacterium]
MNKQIIFLNRTNEHNTGDMLSSVYHYLHNDFIGKGIEMIWLDIEKHDPDYLMRCRFVVSNSYHLLYWAALLGKPTAAYPSINSSK